MKKRLGILVFGVWAAVGWAEETFSQRLTSEEYERAGLGKLSPAEMAQLDGLFKMYGAAGHRCAGTGTWACAGGRIGARTAPDPDGAKHATTVASARCRRGAGSPGGDRGPGGPAGAKKERRRVFNQSPEGPHAVGPEKRRICLRDGNRRRVHGLEYHHRLEDEGRLALAGR